MSERLEKIPQLDALRALAAISIIGYHFVPDFLSTRLPYGWIGVDLFFVISGFLITAILVQQRAVVPDRWRVLRNFIIKRSLRLFPAYFALIAVFAVLMTTTGLWSWDNGQGVWYWTYTSNILQYLHGPRAGHLTHLWSLAVEEQFYVIWPWFILFLPVRWLGRVVFALVVFGFAFKSFSDLQGLRMLPFAHLDTLGIGALIAIHRSRTPRIMGYLQRYPLQLVSIGVLMLLFHDTVRHVESVKNVAVLLITTPLVVGCLSGFHGAFGKLLRMPWLGHLGRISYGLYLYHKPVPLLLKPTLSKMDLTLPGWSMIMVSVVLTWCVAELSFRFLEGPFLGLKEKFDV